MSHDNIITSTKNPKIKSVVELREHKERERTHLMIVEGLREIICAKEAGITFKELYVCPALFHRGGEKDVVDSLKVPKTALFETTEEVFAKISFGDRKEGLLAVGEQPQIHLNDLKIVKDPLIVVVEQVEKPGNLGAILRSCDGAGVDGVILSDVLTDVYNPNVIRASLGTVFSLRVVSASKDKALEYLQKNKIKICATLPQAKTNYTDTDLTGPLAVVVGSEEKGLSDFWVTHSSIQAKIPMKGKADSLNVSVTTAVLLYEALRQRNKN